VQAKTFEPYSGQEFWATVVECNVRYFTTEVTESTEECNVRIISYGKSGLRIVLGAGFGRPWVRTDRQESCPEYRSKLLLGGGF